MWLSDVSVRRPVLALVLNALLLAFGLLSFERLPLREYPDIDAPVVSVSTDYPGASAAVVENKITEIIEDRIAIVSDPSAPVDRGRHFLHHVAGGKELHVHGAGLVDAMVRVAVGLVDPHRDGVHPVEVILLQRDGSDHLSFDPFWCHVLTYHLHSPFPGQ